MATHEHDYYMVEFVFGLFWECECGVRPDEAQWNVWNENRESINA